MQLSPNLFSYNLAQSTLIGGMDVFVNAVNDFEAIVLPLCLDLLEALFYLCEFL